MDKLPDTEVEIEIEIDDEEEWLTPPEDDPQDLDFEDKLREYEQHTFEDDFDIELGEEEEELEELSDEDLENLE